MDDYVVWFVIGFGLVIAELLTGTFYLLVIAVAFGAAGVAALLGASVVLQLATAAAFSLGGTLWLRQSRLDGACAIERPAIACRTWMLARRCGSTNGRRTALRAQTTEALRGMLNLRPARQPASGEFVIREINANRLIVAAKPR